MNLCSQKHGFGISAEWVLLQQAIANLPVMALVEQLKRHVAKRSLQRSLNNQILDYKYMIDLCEDDMKSIKFFGICKESMISVENLEIEKWYQDWTTVPVTRSSHHLNSLSSSRIGLKLTRKDKSYVNIQSINLRDIFGTRFGGFAWLI